MESSVNSCDIFFDSGESPLLRFLAMLLSRFPNSDAPLVRTTRYCERKQQENDGGVLRRLGHRIRWGPDNDVPMGYGEKLREQSIIILATSTLRRCELLSFLQLSEAELRSLRIALHSRELCYTGKRSHRRHDQGQACYEPRYVWEKVHGGLQTIWTGKARL